MKRRKICVVITARPSYSRIKSAMRAIQDHPDLELQIVVAGSALLDKYGSAVNNIEKDGFVINEKVFTVLEGENPTSMAKSTGLGVMELANIFYSLRPDIVVSIADRYETIATAIAATYQNIMLAHVQGGEVTGNIDEKVRHAVTKLADLHLVASEAARDRVIRMGEDPKYVINSGCPSIDLAKKVVNSSPQLDFNPYEKYMGVGEKPDYTKGYLVVMQHPVTTEFAQARKQINATLEAVHEMKRPTFWFWPNVDAGSDGTSSGIRSFREIHRPDMIHFFKNMEPEDFLKLLFHSECLIGNSSVGIRECAFLGLPVVNIGSRQTGRERGANVLDVDYSKNNIKEAVSSQATRGKYQPDQIYGNGQAGDRIAEVLANINIRFHKTLTY